MLFKYRNKNLQKKIISLLEETDVKFRIKKDKSIEFAKKWYPEVYHQAAEIRYLIFNNPVSYEWRHEIDINKMLHLLAERNVFFIIEKHDETIYLIFDEIDGDDINEVDEELGLNKII
ncbi:MAG: hypothetical protein H6680_11080, partial [Desulfobacteraceae bacterium]|nr:hypothetical protein [Desulfobacteraceae bacterium]